MITISNDNKIEFYKFLNDEKSIPDLEKFIYSQAELEKQLGNEVYFELITLNFNDKYDKIKLPDLIKSKIIEEGEFETWKLKNLLNEFLSQPKNIDKLLVKFYNLYCGEYQENKPRKYEYRFLGNLGLNYIHFTDKEYSIIYQGNDAKLEYLHCYDQLKVFAAEILVALDNKTIVILNDGTYEITKNLRKKLESNEIYKLKQLNGK